jgi:hypothetical protein
MAAVGVVKVGSGVLPAGGTHHWTWNNAPAEKVWWFSVDVRPTKWTPLFAPVTLKIEVSPIEYRLVFQAIDDQERELHCRLRNTGTSEAVYDLRLAFTPAGGATPVDTFTKPYFSNLAGAVNTSYSFTTVQNFNPPRRLHAWPVLQRASETDDLSDTVAFISEFTNDGQTQSGAFPSIKGDKVSRIVWAVQGTDSVNNPLRVILFFD